MVRLYVLWFTAASMLLQFIGPITSIFLVLELVQPIQISHSYGRCTSTFFASNKCDCDSFYNSHGTYCACGCKCTAAGAAILIVHYILEVLFSAYLMYYWFTNEFGKSWSTTLVFIFLLPFVYVAAILRFIQILFTPALLTEVKQRELMAFFSGNGEIHEMDSQLMNHSVRFNLANMLTENLLEFIITVTLFASRFLSIFAILFSIPMFLHLIYRIILVVISATIDTAACCVDTVVCCSAEVEFEVPRVNTNVDDSKAV